MTHGTTPHKYIYLIIYIRRTVGMSNLNNTLTMEITINAIHFDATEKLQDFIEKKVQKLQKSYEDIKKVEVKLTVVKPATALNKQVALSANVAGTTVFVEKTCDTFEEAVDLALDAMKVKMTKIKEKSRNH